MGKANDKKSRAIAQAGVIAYRVTARGRVEVLLITNRSGQWIVPKGMIDEGVSARQAAMIEALEEAGAVAKAVEEEIGSYEYEKWGRPCRVRLFAMRVERLMDRWLERSSRRREWFNADDAAEKVEIPGLRRVIERFARRSAQAAEAAAA